MGVKSQLETTFDYDIVSEFINHYDMAVDSLELLIGKLDRSEYYSRNVNELFRIFHNIKSAAGYLHLRVMNKFATDVEVLLEIMRKKAGPANDEIIDWLFACSDLLTAWNESIRLDELLSPLPEVLLTIPKVEYN